MVVKNMIILVFLVYFSPIHEFLQQGPLPWWYIGVARECWRS